MINIVNQIRVIKKSKLENTEKADMITYIIKANARFISDENLFNLGMKCGDLFNYSGSNTETIFNEKINEIVEVLKNE